MADGHTSGVERLARLLTQATNADGCRRCLDALEEYCARQLAGEPVAQLLPEVAEHLDLCVACAESYALVYESLLAGDGLPEAPAPAPDLSFLTPLRGARLAPPQLRSLGPLLSEAVGRAGARLRLTLSDQLLALLPPRGPELALRAPGEPELLFELAIETPGAAVEQLAVAGIATVDPQRCDLRVRATLRGREWPDLAGIAVTLRYAGQERRATTDAWGEALFSGVPREDARRATLEIDA
jgi:hypothetical protein